MRIKKWLWCSWRHRSDRCYPEVWKVEPGSWHCARCHSCEEALVGFHLNAVETITFDEMTKRAREPQPRH